MNIACFPCARRPCSHRFVDDASFDPRPSLDVLGVQKSVYVFVIWLFVIVPKWNRKFLNRPLDTLVVSLVGVQRSV